MNVIKPTQVVEVFIILFYFLFPALVLYLDKKYHVVNKIGPVVICYSFGLLIGNTGILPDGFDKIQDAVNTIVVPLAIPLLLFSLNVRAWIQMAGKTFLSLLLGLASVVIMVAVGFFLFRDSIPEAWKVSGMLIGVYSGGTPNLASIKMALDVDPDTFLLTHIYDLAVGAVVLVFLLTVAQRTFLLFMSPYKPADKEISPANRRAYFDQYESIEGITDRKILKPLLMALGLSALIFAVAGGLSLLVPSGFQMTFVILTITTAGIAFSFVQKVNRIEKTFQAGIYFILVFCLVVASMADFSLFTFESWQLLMWIVLAVVGSLVLHGILSRIFNVDVDNFLIISVALSMSPPFVPVVASALKNREIILPGLIIGIIGYAMGNYLGVLVAYLFQSL